MKITILGCGSFFVDKKHKAPGYLMQLDNTNILVDCGPGTEVQLAEIDFDPLDLDYIFISHIHADHASDLLPILMRAALLEKHYGGKLTNDIKVVGPEGIGDFVRNLSALFNHGENPMFDRIKYLEYKDEMNFKDFSVEPIRVEHLGLDSYGLKFKCKGKVFSYTGDATLCAGVKKLAQGCDLLIADCAVPKGLITSAHMSSEQVGELCRDCDVKKVILTHQVPPGYGIDMVAQAKEIFDGDVSMAQDLMTIEL